MKPKPKPKICSTCKVPKLIDCFNRDRTAKDGRQHMCRVCQNNRDREAE